MPDLTTRTARRRLPAGELHWTRIARGRALGYRRPKGVAGSWWVRLRLDGRYVKRSIATVDDVAEADGVEVLSYAEAVERARDWSADADDTPSDTVTVAQTVERYLAWYKDHRKSYDSVRNLFEAHILPDLGKLPFEALTPIKLRRWHQGIAAKPARLRGGQQREATTEDAKRARKASANHALVALKAALNRAVDDGLVEGPGAWSKVKAFRGVDTARARYLEPLEIERLLNACPPDFRDLVTAALHTGARFGELVSLRVGDYLPETQAVHLAKTKTGAPRHVYLSEEAVAFFDRLTAGRRRSDLVFTKAGGTPWGRNHQSRPMREACNVAGLEPIGFHQLRHTYASHYLMNGGSLIALARQLGHSTTRMVEKHYGHLSEAWRAEEARKHAPTLGRESDKVARLRKVARRARR